VWLGDIPVATLRPNGATVAIYYVHTDPLNTPRQVTRPSDNTPMWTWNSDPFGTDAANPNPAGAGTFAYNLRLPGQVFDGHAGIHSNGHRDYDPAVGRYAESDPIGLGAGLNTYAYVGGSPTTLADPLGLWASVSVSGNTVSIELPIEYSGPGATPERIREWNDAIERAWSGQKGRYRVQTRVTKGSQNKIRIECGVATAKTDKPSYSSGTWYADGDIGEDPRWIAAHEAGHLMGMDDKYSASGPSPGWEHDIMGAYPQPVTELSISQALRDSGMFK
jgi:RHS repeat-associated protein